jgi:hypothetical protein
MSFERGPKRLDTPELRVKKLQSDWEKEPSESTFLNYARELFRQNNRDTAFDLLDDFEDVLGQSLKGMMDLNITDKLNIETLKLLTHPNYYAACVNIENVEKIENFNKEYPQVAIGVKVDELSDLNNIPEDAKKFITGLDFSENHLRVENLEFFLNHPIIKQLKVVNLEYSLLQSEEVKLLVDSENISGWRHVNLRGNYLGSKGAKFLVSSENVSGWRDVNLGGNYLGSEGAKFLVSSENVKGWRDVNLWFNELGSEGAKFLVSSENVSGWRDVDLEGNRLGQEGKKILDDSPYTHSGWIYNES